MKVARNFLFCFLAIVISNQVALRADFAYYAYSYMGTPACYVVCSAPDACGGSQQDCTIGGFDQNVCGRCYGEGWGLKETLYCHENEADFTCQVALPD